MSLTTRVGLLAGTSALMLTSASYGDGQPRTEDYEARIAELEAQVARLGGDHWLTEQRADEIRGLVQDVLADADTRASLLQSSMTAGYDNGFVISSGDGNFMMRINGHLQTRFLYNNQGDDVHVPTATPNSADTSRSGFEVSRARLIFSGNIGGPAWGYYIDGGFGRATGTFGLRDGWISYDAGDGWTVKMGQMRVPFQREFLVDSMNQLTVERSNVSYLHGAVRTQGIALDYAGDQWHFTAAYTDGAANLGPWNALDTEYALTARIEALLSGNWGQFNDHTSAPGSEQGIMVGGAIHYESGEFGTAAANELELLLLTADISAEFDGANVFAAVNYSDNDSGTGGVDFESIGFVVQGGLYFNDKWEGFLRYEWNDFDNFGIATPAIAIDDISIVTVGVNGYYTNNIKMTADVGYAFDGVAGAAPITGYRVDAANDDGQFVIRTQLQLTF